MSVVAHLWWGLVAVVCFLQIRNGLVELGRAIVIAANKAPKN